MRGAEDRPGLVRALLSARTGCRSEDAIMALRNTLLTSAQGMLFMAVATSLGCSAASDSSESGEDTGYNVEGAWAVPPCGAVLASWDGTSARSNGGSTGTGNSCAGAGTYGLQYQCVELVMRHFKTHW